jgi:hypothetical protein
MKTILLFTVAVLCFGATESRVPRKAMAAVESSMNKGFRQVTNDPYDLLGTARGSYLDGYGAVFTIELQLVYITPPSPFQPAYTPVELAALKERKLKKLPALKDTMRSLMAAAGNTLDNMPGNEHIAMEAIIWRYSWEDSRGVPQRVLMTAEKGKLLQAAADHANLAGVIDELEQ